MLQKLYRFSFSLVFPMLLGLSAYAQTVPNMEQVNPFGEEDARFVYKREFYGGGTMSNRGFGGVLRYAIVPQNFMKVLFETELVNIKHPKEYKTSNPYFNNSKLYVYGKQNSFFSLRTGVGTNLLIFDRAPKDGVEISTTLMGGVSWGLLKPIYLEIIKDSGSPFDPEVVSEKFNKYEHNETNILGYSGFTKGMDELKLHPGLYAKAGLNFDWSAKDDKILSLEVGTVIDQYFSVVPIMADFENLKNKSTFISLYATITFGKKY